MGSLVKNKGFIARGTAVFKSGTQTGVSTLTDFSAFETVVSNDSTTIIKDSIYQVTLKAGRKYKITCTCHVETFSDATNGFAQFNLVLGGTAVTFYQAASLNATGTANFQRSGPLIYIYTATADTTVKVTVGIYGAGTATVGGGNSICTIEEIEAYTSLTPVEDGNKIAAAAAKTTPVDADLIGISDSAATNILKKLTWANLKATIVATAMTWSGKQTFDGGAAIKGIATAPAAGYVGEVVSADITDTSVATSDTAVTLANGLVLGIGRWEIVYACLVIYTTGASLNDRGQTRIWVYEQSAGIATVVGKTLGSVSCRTVAATGNDMQATLSSSCIVDITTGTKDYRLGCKRIDGAGTGSATVYGGDFGTFYAVRRA